MDPRLFQNFTPKRAVFRSVAFATGRHLDYEGNEMLRRYTLEYWIDDGWYVGKLKEIPGVFSVDPFIFSYSL